MGANNGAEVLDQTRAFIERFARLPSQAALDVVVLFAAHTHAVDQNDRLAYETTPRLMLGSAGPGSGKSRVLELIQSVSHNAQIVNDPTAPSFAELASMKRATILVDELDCLLGKGGNKQDLRSLFNAGYKKKTAYWSRAGKSATPTFAAVAFAGMSEVFRSAPVLAALRSRTIVIEMVKSTPPEAYKPRIHDAVSDALRADLADWVGRNTSRIMESYPEMPDGITDRLQELAEPLIQLADVAGGHWGDSARNALRELLLGERTGPDPLPLSRQLLHDLEIVFAGVDRIGSVDAVEALYALPESRWTALWPAPVAAPRELSSMLAPLGIEPVRVRLDDGQQVRGYRRSDLESHWFELDEAMGVTV